MLSKQKKTDQSFAALRSLMWRYKWRFAFVDFMRIISSVSITFVPYVFAQLATSGNDKNRAFTMIILIFVLNTFHWGTWHIGDYFFVQFVAPTFYEFKKISFAMFWDKQYREFIEKPSGKVGHYTNELRNKIRDIHDSYHYGFLPIASAIPIYIVLFYKAAWRASVIYGIFLIVALIILLVMARPMRAYQRKTTDAESSNAGRVFDSYANFVNVFSFRAQRKEVDRNNAQVSHLNKTDIKAGYRIMNYWTSASALIRLGLWSSILFYSWHMYSIGKTSFASLIVAVSVLFDFTAQYWNLVHHIGMWNRNSSSFREAYNYLFGDRNVVKEFYSSTRRFDSVNKLKLNDKLEIRDLTFAYPDAPGNPVLKNINISVAKNEKIGIVGKSGSGKSTLIKILLGFYPVTSGEILVDNNCVQTRDLAQLYAYVPQDTTLFQESIYYNIAYASINEPTKEQVYEAAEKAHISEFIESLPKGYDTLVGERGVKLSLGQRQRIAIARAFLKQSDLLILDEATSSLDSKTETYVQESFEKLWGEKSVIAIAHRLSTLNNVDRIIVMSKGEIVEQGTKQELLDLNGYFADLWNHQRKGMI
ncbi:MAG: ABC transporter ATP-binding protein [Acidimicrobiia bacterium]